MIADYFGSIERLLNDSPIIVDKKLDFTFPHHKHFRSNIQPSKEMGLAEVLSEIEKIILTGK